MDKSASSTRVKAFRTRLGEQYKRVEAYITESEKAQVQAIREQQGCTMDVAIAGLIRLGLAQYEVAQAPATTQANPARALNAGAFSGALCASASSGAACREAAVPPKAYNPIAQFFKARSETLK